ncbi:MAG TPA: shikimate dehydrogenase [Candidatus Acidoferrales bacterium]
MLGPDKICAVVAAPDSRAMWRQFQQALAQTRTVELRLDWLRDDAEISRFLVRLRGAKKIRATLIATCRRRPAGGLYRGTVAKQLLHLAEAVRAGCAWSDLDIETISACPPELLEVMLGDAHRIASIHYFRRSPSDYADVVARLSKSGADAVKIAARCDSYAQASKLLSLARAHSNVIAIPMGELSVPTRILALRGRHGFAYAPVAAATAPGQTSLQVLKDLYRADRFDAKTEIYGVIGDPIGHSLSPNLHNAGFQAAKINAVFLPFLVPDLRDFVARISDFKISGLAVTIPHKQAILRHLDGCDPVALEIGAVNTVVVRGGGKLYGYNTDYIGVLRALERKIPLRGSRVLIFGAGGSARAVAFALARAGSVVCICARRPGQARELARAVSGQTIPRAKLRAEFFDGIVNTTPVGMFPHVNESPLEARELNCRLLFDLIYRPRLTKLMKLAARRGIEIVSGLDMFIAQGTAQFEIWMGQRAPLKPMRAAVLRALAHAEKSQQRSSARSASRYSR